VRTTRCQPWRCPPSIDRALLRRLAQTPPRPGHFCLDTKDVRGLISGLRGLADDAALRGQKIDSKVLELREVPRPTLWLEASISLSASRWLSLRGYGPSAANSMFFRRHTCRASGARAHRADLNGPVSLYRILREEYELPIVSSIRRVEATVAGARERACSGSSEALPYLCCTTSVIQPGSDRSTISWAFTVGTEAPSKSSFRARWGTLRASRGWRSRRAGHRHKGSGDDRRRLRGPAHKAFGPYQFSSWLGQLL